MSEFSLDWPHGWKFLGMPDYDVYEYVGATYTGKHVFKYCNNRTKEEFLTVCDGSGRVAESGFIINAPAPKPEPRKLWVNAYLSSEGDLWSDIGHPNRDRADSSAADVLLKYSTRIACVCITEGDGLEGER